MANDWIETPFAEVINFQEGPGILAVDFCAKGVPLIRLAGLERDGSVLRGCNYLDPHTVAKRWAHFALEKGDVLLSASASLGRIAVVGDEGVGAIPYTGIIRMRPSDKRVASRFIRYLLEGPDFQRQAEMVGVGSVIRHFGPMHLREMSVRLPPITEQHAIAHILSTLDDKIALNRRMSETLEELAQTLFRSWFVDFEPVRAKAEGRDTGIPKSLADLFPDRLVDSALGEIPKGWDVGRVDDVFDLTMGQSPPGTTYNEAQVGIPFFQGRADFQFRFPERRVYCTAPRRFAKAGDTLISVRAPVGDINMATEYCAIGRGVSAARHKTGARSYTYYFMNGLADEFGRFETEGTVFGSISKKDFHNIPCVIVPQHAVEALERFCGPIDDAIDYGDRESRTLATLRDTLLPKLISGELRVREAEKIVESVG